MSLSNLRILSTGNPNHPGIAKELSSSFQNVDFISLSTGVDLTSDLGLEHFRSIIPNYNVFVNVSNIKDNTQEKLLRIAHSSGMTGHVFNVGSIAEYKRWENKYPEYTAEKRQLRETSLELCSEFFKTTHIVVGGFRDYADSNINRMDPKAIVNMIRYIIESPVNIPIVGIEKINNIEMKEQLDGKV